MLAELQSDNQQLLANMRTVHSLCNDSGDVATANLLENLIDETEGRIWLLFEASQT
jgi:starvation-inducible DNA-binding protein